MKLLRLALVSLLLIAAPASAGLFSRLFGHHHAAAAPSPKSMVIVPAAGGISQQEVDRLTPKQFIWRPELADAGPVKIVMSLGRQRAYVYRGNVLIGAAWISSGIKGRESPVGRFTILEKQLMHHSNRYDNAAMPYMQRLNWYGVAMHGGNVPGHPASHGCIRLPRDFAKALYGATRVGDFVYVADGNLASPEQALEVAYAHLGDALPADRSLRRQVARAD